MGQVPPQAPDPAMPYYDIHRFLLPCGHELQVTSKAIEEMMPRPVFTCPICHTSHHASVTPKTPPPTPTVTRRIRLED